MSSIIDKISIILDGIRIALTRRRNQIQFAILRSTGLVGNHKSTAFRNAHSLRTRRVNLPIPAEIRLIVAEGVAVGGTTKRLVIADIAA